MPSRRSSSNNNGKWHAVAAALCLAMGVVWAVPTPTSAQEAEQIELGRAAWNKASCADCHGVTGGGGGNPDFPVGPSLRSTALDRATLVEVIGCGLPGSQMPAWLKGAYTEVECFGMPLGSPPPGTAMRSLLDSTEVEALVDFLEAEIVQR